MPWELLTERRCCGTILLKEGVEATISLIGRSTGNFLMDRHVLWEYITAGWGCANYLNDSQVLLNHLADRQAF